MGHQEGDLDLRRDTALVEDRAYAVHTWVLITRQGPHPYNVPQR